MSGMDGAGLAPRDRSAWLLGNAHPSADRSIRWDDEPFPNLSDPDVLLVDLTTLTRPVLERIGKAKLERARPFIRDKILNHGTVIVMTQPLLRIAPGLDMDKNLASLPPGSYQNDPLVYSNYEILPTQLVTKSVPAGGIIVPDPGHAFGEYVDSVRRFSFYIEGYSPRVVMDDPENSSVKTELRPIQGQEIKDNSGHHLGLALTVAVVDYYHNTSLPRPGAGRLVFLPPPTEPIGDAIGRILSALGKSAPHAEAPPAWAERLTLGRAGEYLERASRLEEDMARIQGEIDGLERQAGEILAHRRLLYSTGRELEDAVVQAFRALGFDDIEHMAGADEEDAAFGMGGGTPYSHGVIEVKGAGRGAQMQDINQCNRWTDQRDEGGGGRPSKGILVANQHRLEAYPESSKARMHVEPNQEERAILKDICIIPSCVLFEAVRRVLGGEAPDRATTEAKIAATKGVLKDVL